MTTLIDLTVRNFPSGWQWQLRSPGDDGPCLSTSGCRLMDDDTAVRRGAPWRLPQSRCAPLHRNTPPRSRFARSVIVTLYETMQHSARRTKAKRRRRSSGAGMPRRGRFHVERSPNKTVHHTDVGPRCFGQVTLWWTEASVRQTHAARTVQYLSFCMQKAPQTTQSRQLRLTRVPIRGDTHNGWFEILSFVPRGRRHVGPRGRANAAPLLC
jgi:hypothetical protein